MSERPRRALTLVEVLAASALLGTLLASMLLAGGNFARQSTAAQFRQQGVAIADDLLGDWFARPDELPRRDEGAVSGHAGWRWRTAPLERPDAAGLGLDVIALELFAPADGPGADSGEPLLRVEFVLPAPPSGEAAP